LKRLYQYARHDTRLKPGTYLTLFER